MIDQIKSEKVPKHIAIIMDGNGRWAEHRNLPRPQGHAEGIKRVDEIVDVASDIGIEIITLFTFSTENWSRPEAEVNLLMNMLMTILNKKIQKLKDMNIKFQSIGRTDRIPKSVSDTINIVKSETENNTGLIMNLAFNYGARQEIVDAVQNISRSVVNNEISIESITENTISESLYTKNLPDPDLLIRTSGEQRISNFLLWQLSYTEFYFTDIFWPEFTPEELYKAILEYQKRSRRFGKVESDR